METTALGLRECGEGGGRGRGRSGRGDGCKVFLLVVFVLSAIKALFVRLTFREFRQFEQLMANILLTLNPTSNSTYVVVLCYQVPFYGKQFIARVIFQNRNVRVLLLIQIIIQLDPPRFVRLLTY